MSSYEGCFVIQFLFLCVVYLVRLFKFHVFRVQTAKVSKNICQSEKKNRRRMSHISPQACSGTSPPNYM